MFNHEKNELLKKERGIGFEDVILSLENGDLLDDISHANKEKYPNQDIFIIFIRIKDYVYLVPYVESKDEIFLKTIIPSRKMNKNTQKEFAMAKLDEFELDVLSSVENGEWESKGNIDARRVELQSTIKHQKKKAISIRISENDLYELKRRALESSIPYQNLIQMLIHQFTTDKIRLSV